MASISTIPGNIQPLSRMNDRLLAEIRRHEIALTPKDIHLIYSIVDSGIGSEGQLSQRAIQNQKKIDCIL